MPLHSVTEVAKVLAFCSSIKVGIIKLKENSNKSSGATISVSKAKNSQHSEMCLSIKVKKNLCFVINAVTHLSISQTTQILKEVQKIGKSK